VTLRPSAHGSLAKTPFAHLLLYLQARKLSGTLAVWADVEAGKKGQDRILFESGALMAMRPIEPAKSLYAALMPLFSRADAPYGFYEGHNLLGQGGALQEPIDLFTLLSRGLRVHVNEQFMDSVLERVRGRSLRVREGTPLDRLELNQRELALVEPLRAGSATLDSVLGASVLPVRDAKRTLYLLTLVRGLEASEGRGSIPAMEMESFPPQGGGDGKLARGTLGDAEGPDVSPERRAPGAPPRPSMAPPPRVTTTAAGVANARSAAHSGTSSRLEEARAEQQQARAAEQARLEQERLANTKPDNENGNMPSAPPAPLGLSAPDEARWSELTKLYARIDELTHYELLNVRPTNSTEEIESAYYALVKKFHPDRLPLSLAPLVRAAQVLFERLTEANETLGNAELRASYDKAVAGGGGTRAADRTMRNVLESTLEFQKAEVLMRRREYTQAMQLLRSALAKSPDDADYHALHAWILHLTNPSLPAPFDEMLRSLDRALKSNPRHERAHFYKGTILKRLKRDGEAVRHFRMAAELNPHNVDAAREVRLASMRRESKPPPGGQGVLSRLFKK
jgi:curved DNA-binding protein CbpA